MAMAKNRMRTALRPTLISLAVASCFTTGTALPNPTGANVIRGTAAIHQAGNLLQITNSPNAIINWQSFSIGANEVTRFLQQSPSSAVLNRVTTQNPSEILGSLQSKLLDGVTTGGRVFLINPNGILFGAGARIDTGGLIASTLRMSDEDFLAGRMRFGDGLGKSVINEGNITTAAGGSVYLVGSAVTNSGIIRSPQGEVVLAAGNSVELVSPGTPNLRVEIAASDNEARNLGQIISDAGRIGIYAGLINNSGSIRADSAVSEGGRILLKASKSVTLEDSSVLSAQGQGGGEIKVLADESVRVAGRLDASAPVNGDGGFVETSAAKVTFDPFAFISTLAPNGKNGTWLLDPIDITIDSVLWATIDTNLDRGNVIIDTTGIQCSLGLCGSISITANSPDLATPNKLQLVAHQNINVNGSVINSGTGTLAMYTGWNGADSQNPTVGFGGDISLNAPITLAGKAVLVAGGSINQTASGAITAGSLLAKSNFGVQLASATNGVGTLAGATQFGSFTFTNGPSLVIGSVDSENTAIGPIAGVSSGGVNMVSISVTAGDLTVNNNIVAAGGNSHSASIALTAKNNITANRVTISAVGDPGEGDGDASVTLVAQNGAITLDSSTVESLSGSGCCGTSRNASLSMNAGSNIVLNSSTVDVAGGANSNGLPGGSASATLTASGSIQLMSQSTIAATGGDGGQGSANGGNGGNASLVLNGGSISISSSSLSATGGNGGFGGSGGQIQPPGNGGNGGSAMVSLNGGPISVTGASTISAAGGSGASGGFGNVAGAGGNGGSAMVAFTGSSITIDGGSTINAFGGSGGFGGSGTASGGNGGIGGDAMAVLTGGSVAITGSTLMVSGGGGGTGGTGSGSGGVAAMGGAGGSATLSVSGGSISVAGSTLIVNGGGGGEGGFAFEGGTGGNGGAGGNAAASLGSGSIVLSGGVLAVSAGSGGDGGSASSGGRGGNGNAGGSASVALTGSSIAITGGNIFAGGGGGGSGGRGGSGSSAGFGGNGGNGGGASVTLSAGAITVNAGFISASGGIAGFGGCGSSGCGAMGAGAAGTVVLAASAGNITVQGSSLNADGAEGATAAVNLIAAGDIMVTSSGIHAFGGCCGPTGGDALVGLAAGGNITVDGGEGLLALGGSGAVNGGAGTVTLAANGGSITVLNTPFSIRAQGGFGAVNGGSAAISMTALSGMTFDNSTVEATGYPFSGPQNGGSGLVTLNAMSGTINLTNGTKVGAVGGTGTVTSGTGLITLMFSGRTIGGYFIDGVESLIVDDPLSPTTGFFVNGVPAILNTNLITIYSGEIPFVDPLVASMNQQADVLADQLKAGDTGEGENKEKKKLPFCSS
jgi:filamentous hemagglutinin family protein